MIKIIAGGKKSGGWALEGCLEYEKRLKKPYDVVWQFMDEEKLANFLEKWEFSGHDYVIVCDERGENISSVELSQRLEKCFSMSQNVVILIGGAYGFTDVVRQKANLVWSFSRLVFPHMLARLIVTEQIYRASQIAAGGPYHHE